MVVVVVVMMMMMMMMMMQGGSERAEQSRCEPTNLFLKRVRTPRR
jgi:hypothetical protein